MTFSIDIQHNSSLCHYAECHDYLNVVLIVVVLNVSVVRRYVVMLSVIAPSGALSLLRS